MPRSNRFLDNLSHVATAAGAIVSVVELVNIFRPAAGIKKALYCRDEDTMTTFVSISWDDLREMRRKASEKNLPSLETLPPERDIVFMSFNPFAPKPHICMSCGKVKWQ